MIQKALGLDLASSTGWGVVGRGGVKGLVGTWTAPVEPVGQYAKRFAALFTWLGEMRQVHGFTRVGYEAPWLRSGAEGGDTVHKVRILHGFPVVVETWCGLNGIPCIEVDVRLVKRALTGEPFAKKHQMVKAAIQLGYKVANDDEADGLAVAMCTVEHFWPSRAA